MTERPSKTPRPRWQIGAGVLMALLAFLAVRALLDPAPNMLAEAPPEILGRWVTDDPRYADRAFVIEDEVFHLELGVDSVLSYRLAGIRLFESSDFDRYIVTYHTREGDAQQEFRLFPDGELRLKNPPDVTWVRR